MTIEILSNKIKFPSFELKITDTGIGVYNSTTGLKANFRSGVQEGFSQYQGTDYGYLACGLSTSNRNEVGRFPFANESYAGINVGNMTTSRRLVRGMHSESFGFVAGGTAQPPTYNIIEKFPFASSFVSTDHGDLTSARTDGCSSSSDTHGYAAGDNSGTSNVIERFPFANNNGSSDVGDLVQNNPLTNSGLTSATHGFITGGAPPPVSPSERDIEKYSFASQSNSVAAGTHPGNMGTGRITVSSPDYGYMLYGAHPPGAPGFISRFPFASEGSSATAGTMGPLFRYNTQGISSTKNGYIAGGNAAVSDVIPTYSDQIIKFDFSSDVQLTDIADLTTARQQAASAQD